MRLKLTKPLIVFDLETTGLDIVSDRIIQISYIKVLTDQSEQRKSMLINPDRPIPSIVTQLTGITDDDVKDAPLFKDIASELKDVFTGCDFAGFNSNHFDIPMLYEEFFRCGIDFDFRRARCIDAMNIFRKMERRNLAGAYEFFCGHKMEEDFKAHRADQDTEATYRVLQGELERYNPATQKDPSRHLENDMDKLADFSKMNDNVDYAGRIVMKQATDANGVTIRDSATGDPYLVETINFGKYKGQAVADVFDRDRNYYDWIMHGDFTNDTKQCFTRIHMRELSRKMNGGK